MNKIFSILLLIITMSAWGQIGIVTDPSGILNVRDNPSGNIIDTIHDGDLYFIGPDSENSIWVAIKYGEDHKKGFVHHSKIQKMIELASPIGSVPELVFETENIHNIDNRGFYGGMNLPLEESFELKEIYLIDKKDTIPQGFQYSKDVLTPFLNSAKYSHNELVSKGKMILYSYKDFIYYRMKIGDGSEYYESIWAVKNGKIVQRLIGWFL